MTMTPRFSAAILGASDGLTSLSGVIAGGAAAHIAHGILGRTVLAGALAATVSMAGGEMLAQTQTDWGSIIAMGLGTLVGAGAPALPLFLGNVAMVGWPLFVLLLMAALAVVAIGLVRARMTHRKPLKSILQTVAVLLIGSIVGFAMGRM